MAKKRPKASPVGDRPEQDVWHGPAEEGPDDIAGRNAWEVEQVQAAVAEGRINVTPHIPPAAQARRLLRATRQVLTHIGCVNGSIVFYQGKSFHFKHLNKNGRSATLVPFEDGRTLSSVRLDNISFSGILLSAYIIRLRPQAFNNLAHPGSDD